MDLRHIQYFMEVVKKGSFSKAADDLHVSQPTISKLIKDLENELDIALLKRTTRKLDLTDAGKVVFKQGATIFQAIHNLINELEDVKNAQQGEIKIGIYPMISRHLFTRTITAFSLQYPRITVRLVENGAPSLKRSLINGQLDLALLPFPIEKDIFDYFPFLSIGLILVVHPDHPLANREHVTWGDLVGEPFIIVHKDFALHDIIAEQCRKFGFEPHIVCEATQWNFMLELVSNNYGITVLPQSDLNELEEDASDMGLKVISIEPTFEWKFGFCWLKGGYLSYAAKEWIRFTNVL